MRVDVDVAGAIVVAGESANTAAVGDEVDAVAEHVRDRGVHVIVEHRAAQDDQGDIALGRNNQVDVQVTDRLFYVDAVQG